MESEHKFMLNDILRKKRKSKMRKPEYPVFLTYGPIHVSPLGWIKTLERRYHLHLSEIALRILLP